MGISNRTANDDVAIRRGPLDENIEVSKPGRYYPEEYSSQINIINQSNVMKGEIPKALAGIIQHYDDFKISTWADDEETRIHQKATDNEYEYLEREEQLKYDTANANYDKSRFLDAKIDAAIERANNEGLNVEATVSEALQEERFQEDFASSPAAQRMWQATFSQKAQQALNLARKDDFQNTHLQTRANIEDAIANHTNMVVSGKINSAQGMQELIPELLKFKGLIPAVEFSNYCNKAFSNMVMMEAIHIEDMFNKGQLTEDAATSALNNLCTNYRQMTFDCVDANGNPILDENGEQEKMTFTLDQATQAKLWKVFHTAKSGGDKNEEILNTSIDDWHIQVGWDDFQKSGLSNNIKGWSIDMLDDLSNTTLDKIKNSNATDKTKIKMAQQIIEETAALRAQLSLSELVPTFGKNVGVAFQQSLSQLKKDLEGGYTGDWSGYTLGVTYGGKKVMIGRAQFLDNLPRFGSESLATREYWLKYSEQLQKLSDTLNNNPMHNVLSKIDPNISGAGTGLVDAVSRNSLVEGEGSLAKINQNGVKALETEIRNYDTASSKYNTYLPLADDIIKGMLDRADATGVSAHDKTIMLRTIASAFAKSGHMSDLAGYMRRTKDGNAASLFSALALNGDSNSAKEINGYLNTLTTDQLSKDAQQKLTSDKALKDYSLDNLFKSGWGTNDLSIPLDHKMYFTDLSDKVKLVAANKGLGKAGYEKMMKELIDPLYVSKDTIKGLPMSRPFRYSPQMKLYQGAEGEKRLAQIVRTSTDEFKNKMSALGMNNYKNISVLSDDETGAFTYMINGHRVKSYLPGVGDSYIGQMLDSKEASKYSANTVGEYNFQAFVYQLGAMDKTFRDEFKKSSFGLNKQEASRLKPGTAQKLFNPYQRTIGQAYGSDDKKLQSDFISIAKDMSSETFFNKVMTDYNSQHISQGGVQNMGPKNEVLRVVGQMNASEANVKNSNAGTRRNMSESIGRSGDFKGHITGGAAKASLEELVYNNTSYVGKINQADVSVPITHAALGNEDYIDAYNSASMFGFEVSDAYIPGVTNDTYSPEREPDVIEKGNIDLNNRPIVRNEDGSYSTVSSFSFSPSEGPYAGREVLLTPITQKGKRISEDEAIKQFYKDGKHLGVFSSPDAANRYAQQLHEDQAVQYGGMATGFAANITKTGFDGTTSKVPTATSGKNYTRNEINDLVDHYADIFQVPRKLAHAMITQESGYQQRVTSHAGAHGLAQLMPATAKGLGVTDSSDAAQNIWGGMKYLSQQFKTFGNWPLALAAYNAGPGAVGKAKGIPNIKETQNYVKNIMNKAGFMISGEYYPVNFSVKDSSMKFIDGDTGALSVKGVNNLMYLVENGAGYKGKVNCIYTNRPELLSDDPKYADYAKYRAKKGSDGKPLFRKGDVDGFQVQVKTDANFNTFNTTSYAAVADSVASHQTDVIGQNDRDSIEALLNTFGDRYDRQKQFDTNYMFDTNKFGLANLSPEEYADYGVALSVSSNPELQARVLNQEFQRAKDILGNDRKAIFALAGGDLRDSNGIIKSWEEVKKDSESFRKQWFIEPSSDQATRDRINSIVANYQEYYKNIRGGVA